MEKTREQLSQFALVNQESKEVNILRKGITYVGRCPKTEWQISLKARVSSRRHAEVLIRDDNTISVYDVGSANGTFVNFQQIERFNHVTVTVNDIIGFGVGKMLPNEITDQDELPIFEIQMYSPTTPPHSPMLVIAEASLTINGDPPNAENLNDNRKKESICNDNQSPQAECASKRSPQTECASKRSDVDSVTACRAQVEIHPCVIDPPPCQNIETTDNRNCGKLNTIIPTISNHSENANMETNISDSNIDKSRIKIEDCIIEIEEDEDDNIILSQAVFAPASEQAQRISQSIYFDIKQELNDFGLNTSSYAPIIDLTEEDDQLLDWIDDSSDLEGCETTEIPKDASRDETADGNTAITNDTKRVQHDRDVTTSDSDSDNIPLNVSQSNKRRHSRFCSESEFESDDKTIKLASIDDVLIKKYLPVLKKSSASKESSDASSSDNEQEFLNRQVDIVPSKKLKPGSNFVESRMDTKGIQLELAKRQKLNKRKCPTIQPVTKADMLNKETRSYIQKERKEKLRSLCTRNVETRASKEIATPSTSKEVENAHKATAKVKVSDGRGSFLCEGTNGTVQPKRYKKPPIVSPHHIFKKVKIANNGTGNATSTKTSSAQDPRTLSTWTGNQPCPIISNPTCPNSSPSDTMYPKPLLSVYPNKHQHDDNPQKTALVLLPPLHIPLTPATVCPAPTSPLISQINATTLNVHPAVSSMISWSSHSFKDYHSRRSDTIPGLPGGATGTLSHTKTWYESYEHYRAIMHPLLTIELWMNIYENWSRAGNNPEGFCAKIGHVDVRSTYTRIQCKTFINNRDIGKAIFRPKVLLIGSYQIIDPQNSPNRSYMQLITYIQHIDRRPIHPKDHIPHGIGRNVDFVVFLTLLTKPTTATIDSTKLIKCDFVSYVSNTIKLFDAVYHLSHSPLLSTVLNPNLDDYDVKSYVNFDEPLYGENFKCTKEILPHTILNESQRQAVLEASFVCSGTRPAVYLLDGPPGTGKTAVILQLLRQLLFHKVSSEQMRILVLAPSNGAIDHLMIKIIKLKEQIIKQQKYAFKMVRVGSLSQIHPDVKRFCIGEYAMKSLVHSMCSENALYAQEYEFLQQHLKTLKERKEDNCVDPEYLTRLRVTKYKLQNFARNKLGQSFHRYLKREKCFIINNCHIICSTLSSSFRLSKYGDLPMTQRINCCIVDEATQSVEQDTLIPLILGVEKLVLVGDPQQLPAITSSPIARSYGYGQSLFSRIKLRLSEQASNRSSRSSNDVVRFLDTQYRMHPHISFFPNNAFYNGRLIDGSQLALSTSTLIHNPSHNSLTSFSPVSCSTASPTNDLTKNHSSNTVITARHCPTPLNSLRPYLVIRQSERDLFPSQQYGNKPEVELVVGLYREISGVVTKYWKGNGSPDDVYTVGIITPYNRQKAMIEEDIKQLGIGIDQGLDLTITTVDGVQGQEKDIVIISNVRMHGNSFVENENRMNVALTRAKYVLYIVGSDNLFEESNLFREIERDAISRNLHVTIPNSAFIRDIIFQK